MCLLTPLDVEAFDPFTDSLTGGAGLLASHELVDRLKAIGVVSNHTQGGFGLVQIGRKIWDIAECLSSIWGC